LYEIQLIFSNYYKNRVGMERKIRLWLGLGTAVLVGGGTPTQALPEASPLAQGGAVSPASGVSAAGSDSASFRLAQAGAFEGGEGGEGEGGEGGGPVLGTINDFRLRTTDPNAFQYDASRQVAAYGAVVYERYSAAFAEAKQMQAAIGALLADPGPATLEAARAAWVAARAAYMQTEAFMFYAGPVDATGGPAPRLNSWPVNEAFLDYVEGNPDAGLVNDPSITINRATIVRLNQAADPEDVTTGWHAIEFLLWGQDHDAAGPGARPATDYVAGRGNNDRRREYLRVITQVLVNDLSILVAAWAPDVNNNYRASILAMDERNAIGRAFNGMAVLAGYEMALKRIGASLRRDDEFEQSRFSDNTAADNVENLRGIHDVYFGVAAGVTGAGFDTLLAGIDPALNERVVAAFDRAEKAVAALDTPYDSILASPAGSPARAEGEEAVAALKELGIALRAAGNRLGVLVLVPGL
jgi:putative iron-regulated protein